MSYYYRIYRRSRYWGEYHVSKRQQLTNLFGGLDKDIERAFFALSSIVLDALCIEYGRRHGKNAEAYARRTYPKWKSGTTKLSGQTAERLLELLPPKLSKEQRYELIRKFANIALKKVMCMANTVQAVGNLEQSSKSDYEVNSSFETASGSTKITVKKSNNSVIIVVAIVVGIILFLFFSR